MKKPIGPGFESQSAYELLVVKETSNSLGASTKCMHFVKVFVETDLLNASHTLPKRVTYWDQKTWMFPEFLLHRI